MKAFAAHDPQRVPHAATATAPARENSRYCGGGGDVNGYTMCCSWAFARHDETPKFGVGPVIVATLRVQYTAVQKARGHNIVHGDRNMNCNLSVIVCTHNPREDYLNRVLAGLAVQTVSQDQWELLVIDNASDQSVAEKYDISWHHNGRHIHERDLGLTHARLRGIREAKGDLLVFIDDDNVVADDYLEQALQISQVYPFLGAWGGTVVAEFEGSPPEWTRSYWHLLAIKQVDKPLWSNDDNGSGASLPCGAGLTVRSSVAAKYAAELRSDPLRKKLGRRGTSLTSAEDTDLVYTAGELGLGWGNFPTLSLTHIIPERRLTEDYIVRLHEGIATSVTLMRIRRGLSIKPVPLWRAWARWGETLLRRGRRAARIQLASALGDRHGIRIAKGGE